ncbi:hypothetical protein QQF64_003202 [Cirrhinus molitorella]|uniref:Uncharacterized protein n=1 Tax=Cirrhinus molitorella TaxID=172907 RepID=A0ABR3MJD4_9TELE
MSSVKVSAVADGSDEVAFCNLAEVSDTDPGYGFHAVYCSANPPHSIDSHALTGISSLHFSLENPLMQPQLSWSSPSRPSMIQH